jgi:hypothetical protein
VREVEIIETPKETEAPPSIKKGRKLQEYYLPHEMIVKEEPI